MTAPDPLAPIRARAEAATPGPWAWDEEFGKEGDTGLALTNEDGVEIVGAYNLHCCAFRADPTVDEGSKPFIAHAREDVPALLAALDAVMAVHIPRESPPLSFREMLRGKQLCDSCLQAFPCPTVAAVSAALGGGE